MAVTMAFCSVCERQVHLSEHDRLSCPVCSTPLLELLSDDTAPELEMARPEVYLG